MSPEAFNIMRCGRVKPEPGRLFHCTSWCRATGPFSAAMTCLSKWNATSARRSPARSFSLTWNLEKTPLHGKISRWTARIVLQEVKANEPSGQRETRNPEPGTASAHLAYHIHQRGLAAFHDLYRLAQCLDKILRFGDGSRTPATVGSCHGAEVDVWIFDANTNGLVFHRTIAHNGDAFLVLLIVEIGTV